MEEWRDRGMGEGWSDGGIGVNGLAEGIEGWMGGRMDGWMDEQTEDIKGWMDAWMDEWMGRQREGT